VSFADSAQRTIAATYALGDAATYDPCGGIPRAVTVGPVTNTDLALDDGGVGVRMTETIFHVRKSQVSQPVNNDRITLGETTYIVEGFDHYNEWEWQIYVRA
jgi:hypothetical protein